MNKGNQAFRKQFSFWFLFHKFIFNVIIVLSLIGYSLPPKVPLPPLPPMQPLKKVLNFKSSIFSPTKKSTYISNTSILIVSSRIKHQRGYRLVCS